MFEIDLSSLPPKNVYIHIIFYLYIPTSEFDNNCNL